MLLIKCITVLSFFHDGGPYHIETRPLICSANQWTGFYMIGTFVMKGLIRKVSGAFRTQLTSFAKSLILDVRTGFWNHLWNSWPLWRNYFHVVPCSINTDRFFKHRNNLEKSQILTRKIFHLTLSWRRSRSYRNQSIDMQNKSMDWFLYNRDLCHKRVNGLSKWNKVLNSANLNIF